MNQRLRRWLMSLINVFVFRRLDGLEPMRKQERESSLHADQLRIRNRSDYWTFRESGLDLSNLNATLFDGRSRKGGRNGA